MKVQHTDDDPIHVDHYNLEALHELLDMQHKFIKYEKVFFCKLCQILMHIDDFADDPSFTRHSQMLHSLYVRERHNMFSAITATQKFNAIHPIIRVYATELYVYR